MIMTVLAVLLHPLPPTREEAVAIHHLFGLPPIPPELTLVLASVWLVAMSVSVGLVLFGLVLFGLVQAIRLHQMWPVAHLDVALVGVPAIPLAGLITLPILTITGII